MPTGQVAPSRPRRLAVHIGQTHAIDTDPSPPRRQPVTSSAPRSSGRLRPTSAAVEAAHRLRALLTLAVMVGVATGLAVAAIEEVANDGLLDAILRRPIAVVAVAPTIGLVLTVLVTKRFAGGDGATTDAYIRSYHEKGGGLGVRRLLPKVIACVCSLGTGAALGFEGPAIVVGGTIGSLAERRLTRRFRADDAKILMVAGAAAGVAAVFKAPLTGIVFALEVPYQRDLARRALVPALLASSASYVTFVALKGTARVLQSGGDASFDVRDLAGGLLVGLLCGVLARLGSQTIQYAKHLTIPAPVKVVGASVGLVPLVVVSQHWFGTPLAIGSGYTAVAWARAHPTALALLLGLFAVRFAATLLAVAAGGVGGLFVPLVAQGAIVGQIVQSVVHAPNAGLFPTVGIAALLGAGYRTPLAAVAFVAEATGQPGFVVPALLACAVSALVMGRWSFSPYQRDERPPNITPLHEIAVSAIMTPNAHTVDADATVASAIEDLIAQNRRWAPVVDGVDYLGMVSLPSLAAVVRSERDTTPVRQIARRDVETVAPTTSIAAVGALLRANGVGAVAVVAEDGISGVVTIRDLSNVERLTERLSDD